MKLHQPTADIYIPDARPLPEALARITHLGIGAHQNDLEFMAFHGIAACYRHPEDKWFGGVVCTDGAGSSRIGAYAAYTDDEKMALDVTGHDHLAAALNGIFDSQIRGGKRYDLATLGRRAMNATYFQSHASDASSQVCLAMDLTPLIQDDEADPVAYTLAAVDRFRDDVQQQLNARFRK